MSSPTLETMVVVFREPGVAVNLRLLPNMRNPSFMSRALKTLRIVVGHGLVPTVVLQEETKLDLLELRQDLATGRYPYLQTLTLQVGPLVSVGAHDLKRLRTYVPTVKVERITAIPVMELPDFCVERDVAVREEWMNYAAW